MHSDSDGKRNPSPPRTAGTPSVYDLFAQQCKVGTTLARTSAVAPSKLTPFRKQLSQSLDIPIKLVTHLSTPAKGDYSVFGLGPDARDDHVSRWNDWISHCSPITIHANSEKAATFTVVAFTQKRSSSGLGTGVRGLGFNRALDINGNDLLEALAARLAKLYPSEATAFSVEAPLHLHRAAKGVYLLPPSPYYPLLKRAIAESKDTYGFRFICDGELIGAFDPSMPRREQRPTQAQTDRRPNAPTRPTPGRTAMAAMERVIAQSNANTREIATLRSDFAAYTEKLEQTLRTKDAHSYNLLEWICLKMGMPESELATARNLTRYPTFASAPTSSGNAWQKPRSPTNEYGPSVSNDSSPSNASTNSNSNNNNDNNNSNNINNKPTRDSRSSSSGNNSSNNDNRSSNSINNNRTTSSNTHNNDILNGTQRARDPRTAKPPQKQPNPTKAYATKMAPRVLYPDNDPQSPPREDEPQDIEPTTSRRPRDEESPNRVTKRQTWQVVSRLASGYLITVPAGDVTDLQHRYQLDIPNAGQPRAELYKDQDTNETFATVEPDFANRFQRVASQIHNRPASPVLSIDPVELQLADPDGYIWFDGISTSAVPVKSPQGHISGLALFIQLDF